MGAFAIESLENKETNQLKKGHFMSHFIRNNISHEQHIHMGMNRALSILEKNKEATSDDESLKPEYSFLLQVSQGTLDPYKYFPYRASRKYEVLQRWSDSLTKFYRDAFHAECMDTLKKGGLTDNAVLQALSKKHVPTPFAKGEGATFFLKVVAMSLYPDLHTLLEITSTKHSWLEPAKTWHKKWFEGFFNDPATAKVKVDVLVDFICDCLPFRASRASLREYIKARGAMTHEEFLALEKKEQVDLAYDFEFKYFNHMYTRTKGEYQAFLKSNPTKKQQAEEVYSSLKFNLSLFVTNYFGKLKEAERPAVVNLVFDYIQLVLQELLGFKTKEEFDKEVNTLFTCLTRELNKFENPTEVLDLLHVSKQKYSHLYDLLTHKPNSAENLASVISSTLILKQEDIEAHQQKVIAEKEKTQPKAVAPKVEQKEEQPMKELTTPIETPTLAPTPKEQSYFVSNGIKLGLLDGSSGSITINKTFIIGKTLAPSDMTLEVKALDCLVLSRP